MKKGLTLIELMITVAIIGILAALLFGFGKGCSQVAAKSWGGSMTVTLDPGRKLVNATWKESQLWLLTTDRPVESEKPKTYVLEERSTYGVLQGKVIIEEK